MSDRPHSSQSDLSGTVHASNLAPTVSVQAVTENVRNIISLLPFLNATALESYFKKTEQNLAQLPANIRLPAQGAVDNAENFAKILNEENLGMLLLEKFNLNKFETLLRLTKTRLPLHAFIDLFSRYVGIGSHIFSYAVSVTDQRAKVSVKPVSNLVLGKQHREGAILLLIRLFKEMNGPKDYEVTLSHAPSVNSIANYSKLLGCTPTFNAIDTSILFDASWLTVMIGNDSGINTKQNFVHLEQCKSQQLKKELPETSVGPAFIEECKFLVQQSLFFGTPSRELIAEILNMSVRTFQRRLAENDLSFKALLEQSRKELAHRYLVETNITIADLGILLGYQDSSQFFRAFKAWFGIAPSHYRQQQQ